MIYQVIPTRKMTLMRWATQMRKFRKLVLKRMKQFKMKTAEVAALSNLSIVTVSNFLEERTFEPRGRTIQAMLEGVGYDFNADTVIEREVENVQDDQGTNKKKSG